MMEMRAVTCFLLVIALFADVSQQQPNTCGNDWVRLGGSCYRFWRESVMWSDAAYLCQENQGRLAEINSLEENNAVVAEIRRIHGLVNDQNSSYWIGASDAFAEGNWTWWSNDGPLRPYRNWAPRQPDNAGGIEDCLEINARFNYKWNDYQCLQNDFFICESSPS